MSRGRAPSRQARTCPEGHHIRWADPQVPQTTRCCEGHSHGGRACRLPTAHGSGKGRRCRTRGGGKPLRAVTTERSPRPWSGPRRVLGPLAPHLSQPCPGKTRSSTSSGRVRMIRLELHNFRCLPRPLAGPWRVHGIDRAERFRQVHHSRCYSLRSQPCRSHGRTFCASYGRRNARPRLLPRLRRRRGRIAPR